MSEHFSMGDIDQYAGRAVAHVTALARRASRFASVIAVFAVVCCVGGFLLGLAALDDTRNVWIVIGGFFAVVGAGAALLGRWRVGSVKRHVPELADEVRALLTQGQQATVLIDTFQVTDPDGTQHYQARIDNAGAVEVSRTLWGLKGVVGAGTQTFSRLTATITALTSYPLLALMAVLISLVFLGCAAIFALLLLF